MNIYRNLRDIQTQLLSLNVSVLGMIRVECGSWYLQAYKRLTLLESRSHREAPSPSIRSHNWGARRNATLHGCHSSEQATMYHMMANKSPTVALHSLIDIFLEGYPHL